MKVTASCVQSLHIPVKFFCEDYRIVLKTFYISIPVNKGGADSIIGAIHTSHILWINILQIMSDSPNVMTVRFKDVLSKIKSQYTPHLLDIGGCS